MLAVYNNCYHLDGGRNGDCNINGFFYRTSSTDFSFDGEATIYSSPQRWVYGWTTISG